MAASEVLILIIRFVAPTIVYNCVAQSMRRYWSMERDRVVLSDILVGVVK